MRFCFDGTQKVVFFLPLMKFVMAHCSGMSLISTIYSAQTAPILSHVIEFHAVFSFIVRKHRIEAVSESELFRGPSFMLSVL